jgi:putative transposase
MKLNQKRRTKRRLPERIPAPLDVPAEVNNSWSFDFMSDTLYSGLRYRVLNIIDEGVREALEIVVAIQVG